jgi:hypothetical protein
VTTAAAKGAGSWGVVNPTCRRDAAQLKFHVDACQPRQPQAKGKVGRGIRDQRAALDPHGEVFDSLEALHAWTDARMEARAERLRRPATGTSVAEAWETERTLPTPLPETLPEPFDVAVRRSVGVDCLVTFEGRPYEPCLGAMTARVKLDIDATPEKLAALDPMTREEASLFFRLVSYRYGRGAMIITTNRSIRDWTELLAGDEVLATAILDRLLHRAHVLNIKGQSYRLSRTP